MDQSPLGARDPALGRLAEIAAWWAACRDGEGVASGHDGDDGAGPPWRARLVLFGAGPVDASGLSLAIVATRWHEEITGALVDSAVRTARESGVDAPTVVVYGSADRVVPPAQSREVAEADTESTPGTVAACARASLATDERVMTKSVTPVAPSTSPPSIS